MKQTIPTNWDDVSLKVGRKIFSLDTSGKTDHEYIEEIINCFEIDYTSLPISDVNILKSQVITLLTSKPKETLDDFFIINGKRYRLITDLKNLTFGEFLDIELLLNNDDKNIWGVIHQLLGVLLREEVKIKSPIFGKPQFKPIDYNSDKVMDNAELFDKILSVNDVYSFATFFLLQGIIYSKNILYYYQTQEKS